MFNKEEKKMDVKTLAHLYSYRLAQGMTPEELKALPMFAKLEPKEFQRVLNWKEHIEIFKEIRKTREKKTTHITFRIPNNLLERLNRYLDKNFSGKNVIKKRTFVINQAIEQFLDLSDEKHKKEIIKHGVNLDD